MIESHSLRKLEMSAAKWRRFPDLSINFEGLCNGESNSVSALIDKNSFILSCFGTFNQPAYFEPITERLFSIFDRNQDGKIDFFEFNCAMRYMAIGNQEQRLSMLLKLHHEAGDQFVGPSLAYIAINCDILRNLCTALGIPNYGSSHPLIAVVQLIESVPEFSTTTANVKCLRSVIRKYSLNEEFLGVKKKPQNIILPGHPAWSLMLRLMQGIEIVVGRHLMSNSLTSSLLQTAENDMNAISSPSSQRDPIEISLAGAGYCQFGEYRWELFSELRSIFGYFDSAYVLSLGLSPFLWRMLVFANLSSYGTVASTAKHCNLLMYSTDCQFVIKQLSNGEFTKVIEVMEDYVSYVRKHPDTLLTRMVGLYSLTIGNEFNYYLVINSIADATADELYDIKGSTAGRYITDPSMGALKDLNFLGRPSKLKLTNESKALLLEQMERDTKVCSHQLFSY